MYINKFNIETNPENIIPFIHQNNFGILVSTYEGKPQATHIPFELTRNSSGQLFLQTHLAKANKQWKHLSPATEILVIFQGANTYISPRWYDHINVPTMNYMAVHVYGTPRIIEDTEEVYQMLKKQIETFEKDKIADYNINSLPLSFLQAEMRALVGLEIKVERIEANFKLSQNRDENNYKQIISQLEQREDTDSHVIASEMKKVYDKKGYKQ